MKPVLHGRDHRPGGADPIPGFGGDYVFLEEQVVAVDGDPLSFTDIVQTYRHLVLECSVGFPGGTYSDPTQDLVIVTNGDEFGGDTSWGWSSITFAGITLTTDDNQDAFEVVATGIVPSTDDSEESIVFGFLSAKFGYYARTDRAKSISWQAASLNEGDYGVTQTGGAISSYSGGLDPQSNAPITRIDLYLNQTPVTNDPWAAGSRASLYGIT